VIDAAWLDDVHNCVNAPNPDHADSDCDGTGDQCDFVDDDLCGGGDDADGDTVTDDGDNCPVDYNADQEDEDCDAYGDVCDVDSHDGPCGDHDSDGDGIPEESDSCPDYDATDHDLYTPRHDRGLLAVHPHARDQPAQRGDRAHHGGGQRDGFGRARSDVHCAPPAARAGQSRERAQPGEPGSRTSRTGSSTGSPGDIDADLGFNGDVGEEL
jgi:hypothetical protein